MHGIELPQLTQLSFYSTGSELVHNTLNKVLQAFIQAQC